MTFPNFDPTSLGAQQRAFDANNATVKINDVTAPRGSLKTVAVTDAVEGRELCHELGNPKPFALTRGIDKPGEATLTLYAAQADAFLSAWSPTGHYKDIPADILITLDEQSSPGLAALESFLKLGTKTAKLLGCGYVGMSMTIEVGGAALMIEVKVQPTSVEWFGSVGTELLSIG